MTVVWNELCGLCVEFKCVSIASDILMMAVAHRIKMYSYLPPSRWCAFYSLLSIRPSRIEAYGT